MVENKSKIHVGHSLEKTDPDILKEDSESMKVEMDNPNNTQTSGIEEPSETKRSMRKSKFKYKLIPEEETATTENTEIISERQNEGIKLTIRISSQKKTDSPPKILELGHKRRQKKKKRKQIWVVY